MYEDIRRIKNGYSNSIVNHIIRDDIGPTERSELSSKIVLLKNSKKFASGTFEVGVDKRDVRPCLAASESTPLQVHGYDSAISPSTRPLLINSFHTNLRVTRYGMISFCYPLPSIVVFVLSAKQSRGED